tara:strand:+ start:775 stop:1470 length:696 start_codon:yes stop_codon:yes gene_type:complete
MDFSLIIPCFNEEKNIDKLLSEIKIHLSIYEYEIIIIDDKSTDKSLAKLESSYLSNLKIIKNPINMGQSFSIYAGVKEAITDTIITIDCDGQNNPEDIPKLYQIYKNSKNIDLVSGIRVKRKDNLIKKISSKIANYIRNIIFKDKCKDTGCSLKVFNKKIFLTFPYFDGIHRFIPSLYAGIDKEIIYVNVDHRLRIFGESKYGTLGRLLRGIRDMIKVYKLIKNIRKVSND